MVTATYPHSAFKVADAKDIDAAGQKIVGLAAATGNGDALRFENLTGLAKTTTGSYTGDNSVNRAIPHGLGQLPKLVSVFSRSVNTSHGALMSPSLATTLAPNGVSPLGVTMRDMTNFYVGNASDYEVSLNKNLVVYDWVAIS